MPVPKRKTSKSRRNSRHANKNVLVRSFATCSNCSDPVATHAACQGCGFYKGKKVLNTKGERSVRRSDARKEKEGKQEALRQKLEAAATQVEESKKAE